MRVSVTIPSGKLEDKLNEFNKHERSALIKMALEKWFMGVDASFHEKSKTSCSEVISKSNSSPNVSSVMGDFAE